MSLILQLAFRYFRATNPLLMLWHLIWTVCVISMLLITYIVTFNFFPVVDMWRSMHSSDNFSKEINTTVQVDNAVTDVLNTLLDNTSANRAYVFRYHNGTPSPDNVPFLFFTNTHEVIRPGANRLMNLSQHLPASLIHSENVDFINNKCILLKDLNKDSNSVNYWIYQLRNSITVVRCPFFSQKGDLIGFVGVDYTNNVDSDVIAKAQAQAKESAKKLTTIYAR